MTFQCFHSNWPSWLGEPVSATRLVQVGVHVLQRRLERIRDGVEAPVVVADAPRPVLFLREHHRRRVTGRRVLNPASSQQVSQLAAQLRELPFGQPLDL